MADPLVRKVAEVVVVLRGVMTKVMTKKGKHLPISNILKEN